MNVILIMPLIVLISFRVLLFKGKFSPLRNIGDTISVLFLLSLIMGVIFSAIYPECSQFEPSLAAMVYLSTCFILYFFPLYYFQRRKMMVLNVVNLFLFKFLCIFLLIGGFFAIIKSFPLVMQVFGGEINVFRLAISAGTADVGSKTIIDTFAVGFSTFFGIAQLLGLIVFSSALFGKWSKWIGLMLLFSSFSYVFNVFTFAGRDGVVYWILSFLFNICLIKGLLNATYVNKLNYLFGFIVLLLFVPFFLISISRFSSEFFYYIFSYMSQQLCTFNDVYVLDPPIYYGDLNFSGIKGIFIEETSILPRDALHDYYFSHGVIPWRFKFFIGSLLADFGRMGTIVFMGVISFLIFILLVKKRRDCVNDKVLSFDVLLLLYFYCQIGFMGVFYFKHSSLNNYVLSLIGLALIFLFLRLMGLKSIVSFKK